MISTEKESENRKLSSDEGLFSSIRERIAGGELGLLPVILALIVIWIAFQMLNPHFLEPRNLSNLVQQIVVIGTLAIGVTFVLLLGEIDLSIAAVSGVSAGILVILATVWTGPVGALAAIGIAILAGVVIGLFQGFWVTMIGGAGIYCDTGWLFGISGNFISASGGHRNGSGD